MKRTGPWVTKSVRLTRWNEPTAKATLIFSLRSIQCLMNCEATRVSKNSCKKFSPRRRLRPIRGNLRHESTELLCGAEAAQRLQGSHYLCDRWMARHADCGH